MRHSVHILLVWILLIFAKLSFAQTINPYHGGSADGHSTTELINQAVEPLVHFNAYFGGSGDGAHTAQLINQSFNPPVHLAPYFGGSGDGQDMDAIEVVLPPVDVLPPDIVCPANISVNSKPGQCYAHPNPGTATATDNVPGIINITGIRSDGQLLNANYPKGLTTIMWTATDVAGNSSTCTQTVTVADEEKPVIDFCPADKTINTLPTSTTCNFFVADADLGVATAHDNCDAVTISRQGVPAGNIFPVGETIITYSFADASNNAITCTRKITVLDKTKPVIACPQNVTVNTTAGACNAIVSVATIGTPVATENCGGAVNFIASGVPAGNVFPLCVTTLTWSATDASGNISTCTQKITVQDKTKPVIVCPASLVVNAVAGQCYAVILPASLGIASAIDNCNGSVAVTRSSLPANNKYPVGITTITYTANDAANNTVTCTQTITIKDIQPPVISNVSANPSHLWPADKKMKDVTINYKSADNCAVTGCVLSVSSSEPVTGKDDKTTPDWQIIDDHRIKLRAERISKTKGRTYTITITCTDKSGNKTTSVVRIKVKEDDDDDDDRPGGTLIVTAPANTTDVNKDAMDNIEGLQVSANPNPTNNHFRIEIKSNNKEDKITMQVVDVLGRRVELRNNLQTDAIIRVGDKYKQGAYFIRIMQGDEYKVVKLIKLSD